MVHVALVTLCASVTARVRVVLWLSISNEISLQSTELQSLQSTPWLVKLHAALQSLRSIEILFLPSESFSNSKEFSSQRLVRRGHRSIHH
jgi:hypothetical protein